MITLSFCSHGELILWLYQPTTYIGNKSLPLLPATSKQVSLSSVAFRYLCNEISYIRLLPFHKHLTTYLVVIRSGPLNYQNDTKVVGLHLYWNGGTCTGRRAHTSNPFYFSSQIWRSHPGPLTRFGLISYKGAEWMSTYRGTLTLGLSCW